MRFNILALIYFSLLLHITTCVAQSQQLSPLNYLIVTSEGADVFIEWELTNEDSLHTFEIYRKFDDESAYTLVHSADPDGSMTYQFLDDDIFKNSSRVISYELRIISKEETFTEERSLLHSPTSIQRTWGSIKSMFK